MGMGIPVSFNHREKFQNREIKTIEMAQGQKISRFVAWTFLNPTQQQEWKLERWKS